MAFGSALPMVICFKLCCEVTVFYRNGLVYHVEDVWIRFKIALVTRLNVTQLRYVHALVTRLNVTQLRYVHQFCHARILHYIFVIRE